MPLPPFSPSHPIQLANARQDKIDLSIDLGCIRLGERHECNDDDIRQFQEAVRRYFAGPARNEGGAIVIRSGYRSRLFSRGRVLSVIMKERPGIGPGALFAGELRFDFMRYPVVAACMKFQGHLNPSRYARHQAMPPIPNAPRHFENDEALRNSLLRRNPNASGKSQDEFSLDGNDNWLPQAPARLESFTSAWDDRLREYMQAVRATLEMEIRRVCERINLSGKPVSWHPSPHVEWSGSDTSLQGVETYWEFRHPTPLQLVNSLESELRAYCTSEVVARHFRGREEREERLQFGTEKSCRFLIAEVAPGVRLVIYAKTNQRVRFEVRHGLSDLSHRRGLAQTCNGALETCERITTVSADAAEVLSRFFSFLRSRVEFIPTSYTPLDLLFQCAKCAEKPIYGDAVLRMLIAQERVTKLPALTNTIRAMVRGSILERVDNEQGIASESYVVTPQYRQALEVLRRLEAEHPITGIVRRRRIRSTPTTSSP